MYDYTSSMFIQIYIETLAPICTCIIAPKYVYPGTEEYIVSYQFAAFGYYVIMHLISIPPLPTLAILLSIIIFFVDIISHYGIILW